jgi:hypothetical protein
MPVKVIVPSLSAWVKQRHSTVCEWVLHFRRSPFEFIAAVASVAQIPKFRSTTAFPRHDVVYNHGIARIELPRLAISTAVVICFQQLLAQFNR